MALTKLLLGDCMILAVLIPMVHLWNPAPTPIKYPVCKNKVCKQLGQWYHDNMNRALDPCVDFFEFACGLFAATNPRPSYLKEWQTQDMMSLKATDELTKVLSSPIKMSESYHVRKGKVFFQFCNNRPTLKKGSVNFVYNHLQTANEYAQDLPWALHEELLRRTDESSFFSFKLKPNEEDHARPVLQLREIRSPYGTIYHAATWSRADSQAYSTFLFETYKIFQKAKNWPGDDKLIRQRVKFLTQFRKDFNMIIRRMKKIPEDEFKPITVNQLQNWYDRLDKHTNNSKIDWKAIISAWYSNTTEDVIEKKKIVAIQKTDYFKALTALLESTPMQIIRDHIEMYFIERHLDYPHRVKEIIVDFLTDQNDFPRSVQCVGDLDMTQILRRIHRDNFVSKTDVDAVQEIVFNIKKIIQSEINMAHGFRAAMKQNSMVMIDSIEFRIGYPPSIPEDTPPLVANVFFNLQNFQLYISPVILHEPLFDRKLPPVLNIAGLGFAVAHKMYHAFGDCGTFRAEVERQRAQWWTAEAVFKCVVRKQCFVNVYNQYMRDELGSIVRPQDLNALNTFVGDFADVMGLQAALRYYRERVKRTTKCEVLPHFEKYNCDQMFYIAFANSMCSVVDPEVLRASYANKTHNMRRIRVNGAIKNDAFFGRTFGCNQKTPMNPTTKCNMWH